MANLAPVPNGLIDEQVLMCPNILSTGVWGGQCDGVRIGDPVAVFGQGPIGLYATAGARLLDATRIIAVDPLQNRRAMALRLGVSVAIEALARREASRRDYQSCVRAARCRRSASIPAT